MASASDVCCSRRRLWLRRGRQDLYHSLRGARRASAGTPLQLLGKRRLQLIDDKLDAGPGSDPSLTVDHDRLPGRGHGVIRAASILEPGEQRVKRLAEHPQIVSPRPAADWRYPQRRRPPPTARAACICRRLPPLPRQCLAG